MMSKAIEGSKAEVVFENLPMVNGDELQLGQGFQNLLGNALKFHGDRAPRIQVRAESMEKENLWRISVADKAMGIDKQKGARRLPMFPRPRTREGWGGQGS